jgi:PhoD-like phosphatase
VTPPDVTAPATLVLGPLLRYAGTESATFWVETSGPCEVEVLGHRTRTFTVEGHHYALLVVDDLEPASVTPYDVRLDGVPVWPPDDDRPGPVVHTRNEERRVRLIFGSCRVGGPQPATVGAPWSEELSRTGVDALWLYSRRLQRGEVERPDALLLLGDQVYADEVSPATLEFIRGRRDTSVPPGEQVADFEEFTQLYRESWSEPDIRWLFSTVPTAMIFDDHDVNDDWNISWRWIRDMRAKPWWDARITGAFMAYWIYQHIGNLSPPELAEEEMLELVRRDGDAGPRLREFARRCDRESAASRWAYHRDFGDSRFLVVDSRAARVLADGRREMVDEEEWDWIVDHSLGSFDHLVIASTLPVFMPHGIHHLEAWNEALCEGRWGNAVAWLSERLRRAVDLEHWAAFDESFDRLCAWLRRVATGAAGALPPASIVVLGGDVHNTYVAEVDLGTGERGSGVFQIVCSPYRNPLGPRERRLVRLTGSRASAWLFSRLARLAGVDSPWASWELRGPRTFENAIGELELDGRSARVTLRRSPREDEGREELVVVHRTSLALENGDQQHQPRSGAASDATGRE